MRVFGRERSDVNAGAVAIEPDFVAVLAGATAIHHKKVIVRL
jgi:hypothetical protein